MGPWPAGVLSALAVALLLAGCAGAGGPSGVITGEALEAPAAEGGQATATAAADGTVTTAEPVAAATPTEPAAAATHAVPPAAAPAASAATSPAPAQAPTQASSRSQRDGTRAAPPAQPSGKPKELPYPTFGTPAQIGDKPVMTKEETAKMQQDLETLAKEREAQTVRELEQDQQQGQ